MTLVDKDLVSLTATLARSFEIMLHIMMTDTNTDRGTTGLTSLQLKWEEIKGSTKMKIRMIVDNIIFQSFKYFLWHEDLWQTMEMKEQHAKTYVEE